MQRQATKRMPEPLWTFALSQLEETFTCSLYASSPWIIYPLLIVSVCLCRCREVMYVPLSAFHTVRSHVHYSACPYTLIPGLCGHSFCAICLLKWCFTALHRGCGYWHDDLQCPLCRAELPYTSDRTPRSRFSFPFTPNRLADSSIKALVALVRDAQPEHSTLSGARARSDAIGTSEVTQHDEMLISWRRAGAAYLDWEQRDRLS